MSENNPAWHLNRFGMSNVVMEDLIQFGGVSKNFRGVLPFNMLPHSSLLQSDYLIFIINVGHHFITLLVHPNYIYYIDSLGLPIWREEVKVFCSQFDLPIYYNPTQIQHPLSSHCGLYAVLFVILMDNAMKKKKSPIIKFNTSELRKNDDKCVMYIKECLSFE